ncbi:MAG: hypothetical protein DHS20C11_31240 [Lysobacteraceae bacterium]|nr:MAG: hypothetical protein DHS20C11_31240 [Xanthomonadaceae bacterium]
MLIVLLGHDGCFDQLELLEAWALTAGRKCIQASTANSKMNPVNQTIPFTETATGTEPFGASIQ